eukprot:2982849-Prymnesium_polylepis.1
MATNALHSQATEGTISWCYGVVSSVWPGASGRCWRFALLAKCCGPCRCKAKRASARSRAALRTGRRCQWRCRMCRGRSWLRSRIRHGSMCAGLIGCAYLCRRRCGTSSDARGIGALANLAALDFE